MHKKQRNRTRRSSLRTHKRELLIDATVCPQDISYPTDLDLLNTGREKLEGMIEFLVEQLEKKPTRIYKVKARKQYLKVVKVRRRHPKQYAQQ